VPALDRRYVHDGLGSIDPFMARAIGPNRSSGVSKPVLPGSLSSVAQATPDWCGWCRGRFPSCSSIEAKPPAAWGHQICHTSKVLLLAAERARNGALRIAL